MRLFSLAAVAALIASMSISTTLASPDNTCLAVGKYCDADFECCSDACTWKTDCSEKYCGVYDSMLDLDELKRSYIEC
ncbi:uncharacterized protein F5147DRAFT_690934 [Suillus discolor]|uniref:Uncharacterized protein n=1 Tax=Suillus discolor TaxID=1912936 RepID=A0A9P7F986_9AGAM|nr:uncharacterized protein F5147DRAFT_690934 [Suillus discolor]KAG2109938.1 hypothetical protein F5147DRAFT_690934 [Suillus discolor]